MIKYSDSPRWKHICPGCASIVMHRRVYCNSCVASGPASLKRHNISSDAVRIKNATNGTRKIPNIPYTTPRYILCISDLVICVKCGSRLDTYLHKCYYTRLRDVRSKSKILCIMCKSDKPTSSFPVINDSVVTVSRVCMTCLSNANLVELSDTAKLVTV